MSRTSGITILCLVACVVSVPYLHPGWFSFGRTSLAAQAEVASLRLEAPLDELFMKARDDPEASVTGTLTDTARGQTKPVPVTVALRGHTSRRETECTFPKLKLDLADGKTLKIGTHCADHKADGPSGKYGRIAGEQAPLREAAVYRLLEAVGAPTLKARPARITYVYAGESIERNAMLLEDDDEAVARVGGTGDIDAPKFTTADQMFPVEEVAALAFAEALVGNFDWCLKFHERDTYRCDARQKLWNVVAVAMPGGKARPLIYDFDLAGMVTGSHLWFANVFNAAFVQSHSAREVEVIAQLQRTRSLFTRRELDATRQRYTAKKPAAYRVLEESGLDDEGRTYMREYLDAFYREIESDDRFYRPVVTGRDVLPRGEPSASAASACASGGAIPIGTPVTDPLETREDWIRVVVLDALWHWGPSARCGAIQKGSVWVEKQAVGRGFPAS